MSSVWQRYVAVAMMFLLLLSPLALGEGAATVGRDRSDRRATSRPLTWRQQIEAKLAEKVTLDFADTPVGDVVEFLRSLSGVNMIIDPGVLEEGGDMPITLKVTDIQMKLALNWIVRLARLKYVIRDEAIFISDAEGIGGEMVTKSYDVRDLLFTIEDADSSQMAAAGGGGGGGSGGFSLGGGSGGGGDEEDSGGIRDRAANLIKLVLNTVKPESWGHVELLGVYGEDEEDEEWF